MHCPSGGTPPPGSTVDGGLDVDGVCLVDQVTVNGGIIVEAGGHLQLTSSTVNGGIITLPCGELDINAIVSVGTPTGTTSTINGGIDIAGSAICTTPGAFSDTDIWTAQIDGGISMTGSFVAAVAVPYICGNTVKGSVHVDNVTATAIGTFEATIGDPDNQLGCPGNTITGSLHMSHSSVFAVESNTIGGSVLLSADTLELNGNTINGSLMCSDATVILPGEPTDPTGNTVHGKNTCQ
jgi:hypothetical protein